jgi:hypothetical protein
VNHCETCKHWKHKTPSPPHVPWGHCFGTDDETMVDWNREDLFVITMDEDSVSPVTGPKFGCVRYEPTPPRQQSPAFEAPEQPDLPH